MNVLAMQEHVDDAKRELISRVTEFADMMDARVELTPNLYENWCASDYINHFYVRNLWL